MEWDGTLTVRLDHLGPARATKNHDALALLDSGLGVIVILLAVRTCQAASTTRKTHGILGEGIRHSHHVASALTANLDEHSAETTELARDRSLESTIVFPLGETERNLSDLFLKTKKKREKKKRKETPTYLATKTQALGG